MSLTHCPGLVLILKLFYTYPTGRTFDSPYILQGNLSRREVEMKQEKKETEASQAMVAAKEQKTRNSRNMREAPQTQ
jgi:hypothetical protein